MDVPDGGPVYRGDGVVGKWFVRRGRWPKPVLDGAQILECHTAEKKAKLCSCDLRASKADDEFLLTHLCHSFVYGIRFRRYK